MHTTHTHTVLIGLIRVASNTEGILEGYEFVGCETEVVGVIHRAEVARVDEQRRLNRYLQYTHSKITTMHNQRSKPHT
jgi:hypothetical protein